MDKPGQTCPVVGATTDHHKSLSRHPGISAGQAALSKNLGDAASCPALKQTINTPQNQAMDETVCPVVGPVSSVLPPDHPSTSESKEGDVCPVTKATLGKSEFLAMECTVLIGLQATTRARSTSILLSRAPPRELCAPLLAAPIK